MRALTAPHLLSAGPVMKLIASSASCSHHILQEITFRSHFLQGGCSRISHPIRRMRCFYQAARSNAIISHRALKRGICSRILCHETFFKYIVQNTTVGKSSISGCGPMSGYDHFSEVTAALYLDPGADLSCGDVLPVTDPIIHYPNRLCPQLLSQQHVLIQAQTCTKARSQPDPSFQSCRSSSQHFK